MPCVCVCVCVCVLGNNFSSVALTSVSPAYVLYMLQETCTYIIVVKNLIPNIGRTSTKQTEIARQINAPEKGSSCQKHLLTQDMKFKSNTSINSS